MPCASIAATTFWPAAALKRYQSTSSVRWMQPLITQAPAPLGSSTVWAASAVSLGSFSATSGNTPT